MSDVLDFDPLPFLQIRAVLMEPGARINTTVGQPYSALPLPCSKVL